MEMVYTGLCCKASFLWVRVVCKNKHFSMVRTSVPYLFHIKISVNFIGLLH